MVKYDLSLAHPTMFKRRKKLNNKDYYTTYVNNTEICKDILTEFA